MPSYSGLWNNEYGVNHALLPNRIGNAHTALSMVTRARSYGRAAFRGLLASLIDGAVGDNASASHKRVAAERDLEMNVQGGARIIQTFSAINRATTAADETALLGALNLSSKPTYPVDRSGNGGGNKRGV